MAYTKTIWENSPSENTPISAENLNNIENGISGVDTRLTTAEGEIDTAQIDLLNVFSSLNGTVLYDNATGSNTNITLSDNVNNYNKLLIEYANSSLVTTASRYVTGNSSWFVLQLNILVPGENYVRNNGYSINNNIITLSNSVNYHFNAQGYFYDAGETSAVYITKITGYK